MRCASARRKFRSRRRSSGATPTSSAASSSSPCARRRSRPATSAERLYRLRKTCEGGLAAAELAEREDELENRFLAKRVTFQGEEMPLRNAQAKLAVLPSYADREELGRDPGRGERELQPRPARADAGERGARRRPLRHRRRDRAERGGEGDLAARALARAARGERRGDRQLRRAARALVRAAARRRARGRPVQLPHRVDAAALDARGDVHARARDGGLPARRSKSSASISRRSRTSSSISTTGRRSRRVRA